MNMHVMIVSEKLMIDTEEKVIKTLYYPSIWNEIMLHSNEDQPCELIS